jgi:predicted esterase
MPARPGIARALGRALVALARPASLVAGLAGALAAAFLVASLGLPPSAVVALLGFRVARADVEARPEPPRAPAPAPEPPPPAFVGPLRFVADGRPVLALPAHGGAGAPVTVVLHGMCTDFERLCELVASADRGASFLVCPRGNGDCGGGEPDWSGPPAARALVVDAALDAFDREARRADAPRRPVVLAGYSRGAFTARDLAYLRPGRFGALVLLAAAVSPDPARLAASGVRRVLLAAADFDGARATMVQAARKLTAAGVPARFVGLGPMGHGLPADLADRLAEHVRWVSEPLAPEPDAAGPGDAGASP